MSNPYQDAPPKAFWRTAVAERDALAIAGLWQPKFRLRPHHRIVTFGSCFAQHFARELGARGYNWFDAEPAPDAFDDAVKRKYNYGIFSARAGNIYTAAALRQWIDWALGDASPPEEIWEKDGRFFDPFRPAIEPDGFASRDELFASRDATLRALRCTVDESHRFVFTLGLTEAWVNRAGGYTYAMCPGVAAGAFDPALHAFKNFGFEEVARDLGQAIAAMRARNQKLRFLLTVSPVPLTATASGEHVLTATTYSKSVLRAVAGALADSDPAVDYFPAYEMIAAPPFGGRFYQANQRDVTPEGVKFVMDSFFACLNETFAAEPPPEKAAAPVPAEEDGLACEERMLEAFSK